MNAAIIGYGKMGKEVEKVLISRGHKVSKIIDLSNTNFDLEDSDVAIIFSSPESVYKNIKNCLDLKIPVICGSTGWTDDLKEIEKYCKSLNGTFLFSPNFSIGVNLFFELNKYLSKMMKNHEDYKLNINEKHHIEKVDKPSGTAIKLANDIIKNSNYSSWILDGNTTKNDINIDSFREGDEKGFHEIKYTSKNDEITISHNAKNRFSFALGSVLSAEYVIGKKGVFTINDVINNIKI